MDPYESKWKRLNDSKVYCIKDSDVIEMIEQDGRSNSFLYFYTKQEDLE